MTSRSLQIEQKEWQLTPLGERALVLEPIAEEPGLSVIHKICFLIEQSDLDGLMDVVPTYKCIALLFKEPITDTGSITAKLSEVFEHAGDYTPRHDLIRVPVCYELGLDWNSMESQTGLKKEKIIQIHSGTTYTLAMMGFIPGFLYLEGLDKKIICPRKSEPRTKVPAGSVGIGGDQTGVYSLESPGGWQIIGRTPLSFFNKDQDPPVSVSLGDRIRFEPISEEEFRKMESGGSS